MEFVRNVAEYRLRDKIRNAVIRNELNNIIINNRYK
jgi:hypothetical protein